MWLCWYGKKVQSIAPSQTGASPMKPGLFGRLRNWFGNLFKGSFPSEGEARQKWRELVGDVPSDSVAFIYPDVVPAGTEIKDGIFNSMILEESARVAWIDPLPSLKYGHPTIYLLQFNDGAVDIYEGNGWAVVGGKDIRSSGVSWSVRGSSPSGGFSIDAVTGMLGADSKDDPLSIRVRMRFNSALDYGIGYAYDEKKPVAEEECPPGYIKKELPPSEERGVAFAVVDDKDPNIKFVPDAQSFLSATTVAGFENQGLVTSPAAFNQKLSELAASLEKPSSFAMFISTHGMIMWDFTVVNRDGREEKFEKFMAMDPRIGLIGIGRRQGRITEKKITGFCFGLGGQCVAFSADSLASIKSCRKFLASSACFSGALTENSVPGLSVYAGSQKDKPGLVLRGESLFGKAFTTALVGDVPADPRHPDTDEPKPEFDAAFAAAASSISANPLQGTRLASLTVGRSPDGQAININWVYDQKAVMSSNEGSKNCAKRFECVPAGVQPPKEGSGVHLPQEEGPIGVIPGQTGTSTGTRARVTCDSLSDFGYSDEVVCKRSCTFGECRRVPATYLNPQMAREANMGSTRCWMCQPKEASAGADSGVGVIGSSGVPQVSQPQTSIQIPSASQPVDCESFCASKGMSPQKPSSSSILQQLQQYRCVSGASIKMSSASGQGCVCYSQPQIQINSQPPVCPSQCGPVPCDGSLSCSCGERCTLTVRCIWGGWKEIKEFTYQPIVSSAS